MFMHPVLTAALADQHRRDLLARAGTHRIARTARASLRSRKAAPAQRQRSGLLEDAAVPET